ncbi:hypothetical protein Bbelb_072260 [Branchiostoma belcheri]|nr:hypothetical protein Bbelb_072260 [Branchiostoma belcheri]
MTTGDQSRENVFSPTAGILSPKKLIRIGCWNVRTLFQTGKLAQAVREMNDFNLALLGVTEARWTNTGKQTLNTGEVIIWSGRTDNLHQEGVALIISKKYTNTLLQWKPVNERLLYVRLNSTYAKLSVVVAYAPTNDADGEDKDKFYSALQGVLEDIPRHDVMVLMGDFNARVGNINRKREKHMGKHGMGSMTDNGERLIDICEEYDLAIGGTLFEHKNIHKLTWTSPDGKTESQIDHIMVNNKWKRSLLDVRVMRSADIGSDHKLVVAKISIKLRKTKIGSHRERRFDVDTLKDPKVKKDFSIALKNRFSILEDEEIMTIDGFNEAMTHAAKETIGAGDLENDRRKHGEEPSTKKYGAMVSLSTRHQRWQRTGPDGRPSFCLKSHAGSEED